MSLSPKHTYRYYSCLFIFKHSHPITLPNVSPNISTDHQTPQNGEHSHFSEDLWILSPKSSYMLPEFIGSAHRMIADDQLNHTVLLTQSDKVRPSSIASNPTFSSKPHNSIFFLSRQTWSTSNRSWSLIQFLRTSLNWEVILGNVIDNIERFMSLATWVCSQLIA